MERNGQEGSSGDQEGRSRQGSSNCLFEAFLTKRASQKNFEERVNERKEECLEWRRTESVKVDSSRSALRK